MSERAFQRALVASGAAFTMWLGGRNAHAADDPWFGRDKALHFGVSIVLGASGYAIATPVFDERWQRATAGAAFSLSLGAGKELYDATGAGSASWRDFTWDVVGTVVGVGAALLVDVAISRKEPEPHRRLPAPSARAEAALR